MSDTRGQILEATLARLEAERYQPPVRSNLSGPPPLPALTADEALENARILSEALDDDVTPHSVERRSA